MKYTYDLTLQNCETGILYDLNKIAGNLQYSSSLLGQPGKFTFDLIEDPAELQFLSEGSIITFTVNGKGIFYGFLFTISTDMSGRWRAEAYDQMRYLQCQETIYTENMSASQIFQRVCKIAGERVKYRVDTPTSFIVPAYLHDKKTYYSIIERGIMQTNINDNKYYFIRDDFGTLVFTELQNNRTDMIIGDNSLMTGYQYETSIDKDTYNTIKIFQDNEVSGKRDYWQWEDSNNKNRWGKLQYVETADKNMNEAQIIEKAANLLKWKNRPTKTMKISGIGTQITTDNYQMVTDATKLVAGSSFRMQIDRLGILQDTWILSATHEFKKDLHSYQLDCFI